MIGIIYNPTAGNGKYKARMRNLLVLMDSLHIKYEYRETRCAGDAGLLAKELAERCSTIVPAGGDGTVYEVVTALRGMDVRLSILPYGSGNDVHGTIYGYDCPDEEILEHILSDSDIRVDCATVNDDHVCVSLVTYGFGADLVKLYKQKGGSYLSQTIKLLFKSDRKDYILTVNGVEREIRTELILMTNTGRAGGGIMLNRKSNFRDGEFEVLFVRESGILRRWMNFIAMARGRLDGQPNVESVSTKECTIVSKDSDDVNLDGELFNFNKADIRIIEGGLRFAYKGNRKLSGE